jgi:SAM-dependent methyltransferase/uncharacterized protein YbaR (Trm112 family)
VQPTILDLLRCPRSGQQLRLDVLAEDAHGHVQYGTLTAEGFVYPIVAGIPVLMPGVEPVVDLVRAGRHREATALCALGAVERSRAIPVVSAVSGLRGAGRLARPLLDRLRRRQLTADVARLFGDQHGDDAVTDPLHLVFLDARRSSREGYNYFRYRFGTPRYLVALSLLDSLPPSRGPVLDVGCGAGHLTWALSRRVVTEPVVGIDPSFAQLLVAARLAPDAHFACADGLALPLASRAFHRVLSSDVLPYVTQKRSAVRELTRTLGDDGELVLTALRNSARQHVHGGEPLTPAGWEALVEDLPHRRLLGDDAVLDRYLDRTAPGAVTAADAASSQTVSVVAANAPLEIAHGAWEVWPHARGRLTAHPLLRPVREESDGIVHERWFPSATYEVDNARLSEYLPARCVIPHDVIGRDGEHDAAPNAREQDLIAAVALLALPEPTGDPRPAA